MSILFIRHIIAFIFSFGGGLYLIPILMRAASKGAFVDRPDGKIKTHKAPIPYLGGVAVFVSFVATLALVYPFEGKILWLILGSTFLLFVGLIDDLHALTPLQKIGGQVLATVCFLRGGITLKSEFFSGVINLCTSGFWILLVINAFNLVDVMDGLATLLAIVSVAAFFVISLVLKVYALTLLLVAIAGALLAFFIYNKPPAKMYLGDAGSLFMGGFVAAIPLLFSWSDIMDAHNAYPAFVVGNYVLIVGVLALVPFMLVAVPLLEVISLVIIRTYLCIPFYQGSPHHFSLYLRAKGWKDTTILVFSGGCAAYLALLALLFLFGIISFWIVLLAVGAFGIFWLYNVFI